MKLKLASILILVTLLFGLAAAPNEYYEKARALWDSNDKDGAIAMLAKGAKEHPADAFMQVYLGYYLKQVNRWEESVAANEKAMQLLPDNSTVRENAAWSFYGYARKLFGDKKNAEALKWNIRAAEIIQHYSFFMSIAQISRALGKIDLAVKAVEDSIKPGLTDPGAKDFREWLTWESQQIFGMIDSNNIRMGERLERALLSAYDDDNTRKVVAEFYIACDDAGRAEKITSKITDPKLKGFLSGMICISKGDLAGARKILDPIIGRDPSDSENPDKIAQSLFSLAGKKNRSPDLKRSISETAMDYQIIAAERYFRVNPFKQPIEFYPPLRGDFTIANCVYKKGICYHGGRMAVTYEYDMGYAGLTSQEQMGKPVYAAADGTVVEVTDQYQDNPIDRPYQNTGLNLILIEHAGGLKSVYAHIRKGSSRVKKGDAVKTGDQIAELGNSGYSGGPHLHFDVKGKEGISLPIRFSGVTRHKTGEPSEKTDSLFLTGYIYSAPK
jgi:tetratricopeptide (TPR) repeat protein